MTLCEGNTIQPSDLKLPEKTNKVDDGVHRDKVDLDQSLEEHERELIMNALEKTKWNRTAAARLLGVSFRTLRYRLKKLGIE